jgi:hypothetical protein
MDREGVSYSNFDKRFLGKMGLFGMLQDFYAERLHKIYILHINWVFRMIYNLTKPFVSTRTKKKVLICKIDGYYEQCRGFERILHPG